jgi:hypothetical protein
MNAPEAGRQGRRIVGDDQITRTQKAVKGCAANVSDAAEFVDKQ